MPSWSAPFWAPLVQPPELTPEYLGELLRLLVRLNVIWLRQHPSAPLLYESGVRYEAEPIGEERWATVPVVLALGFGDCEDLACWRVAELRLRGVRAVPNITRYGRQYHITVVWPDGTEEDPSLYLGMSSGKRLV